MYTQYFVPHIFTGSLFTRLISCEYEGHAFVGGDLMVLSFENNFHLTFTRRYTTRRLDFTCWIFLTHFPLVSMNRINVGSDNGLSHIRRQANIYASATWLSIGPSGINFNDILIKIQNFSFTKMRQKIIVSDNVALLPREKWVNEI